MSRRKRRITPAAVAFFIMTVFSGNVFAAEAENAVTSVIDMLTLKQGLDTVWVLVAAFLVFFMQAGFAPHRRSRWRGACARCLRRVGNTGGGHIRQECARPGQRGPHIRRKSDAAWCPDSGKRRYNRVCRNKYGNCLQAHRCDRRTEGQQRRGVAGTRYRRAWNGGLRRLPNLLHELTDYLSGVDK
jgi:hypothetical protein